MISKIYKELAYILLFFLAGLALFTYLNWQPKGASFEISAEEEEQLAELINPVLFSQLEIIENDSADTLLAQITDRLLDELPETQFTYKFHLVESNQVNAFATLGGNVFIFSGLIEATESAEELAAVLAHEIGHVEKRHVVDKMAKEMGLTVVLSLLTGADGRLLTDMAKMLISSNFSRQAEQEADAFGLKLLENAHISPLAMAHAFKTLKEKGANNWLPDVLASHPDINKRIKKAYAYKTDPFFKDTPLSVNYDQLKTLVAQYGKNP